MDDSLIRAGCGTFTAFLTLERIYLHVKLTLGDGIELTRVEARLTQAEPAVVGDDERLQRTRVTRRVNYLHHIVMLLVRLGGRTKTLGKTDPLAVYLALLVHAAAVLGLGSGADLIDELLLVLGGKFTLPGEAADLLHDEMLELYDALIILNHNLCKLL